MSGAQRIEHQLKLLRSMDRRSLEDRYQQLYGTKTPDSVARSFVEAAVGFRLQKQLIARLRHRLMQTLVAAESIVAAIATDHEQIILIRTWKERTYTVTVLDDGSVIFQGRRYTTLADVDRAITGGTTAHLFASVLEGAS